MIEPIDIELLEVERMLLPEPHVALVDRYPEILTHDPLVLVPHTRRQPEVVASLQAAHLAPIWAPCSNNDDYFFYVKEMWELGQTFIINEHDICPKPGDAEELLACDRPWCGRPYAIGTCYQACLGFTKFDASLMREYPEMMDWVGELDANNDGAAQRIWNRLDTRIFQFLGLKGLELHTHWPPIRHENKAQYIQVELNRGWCHNPPRPLPE